MKRQGFDLQILECAIDHAYELVGQQIEQTGRQSLFGMRGWETFQ